MVPHHPWTPPTQPATRSPAPAETAAGRSQHHQVLTVGGDKPQDHDQRHRACEAAATPTLAAPTGRRRRQRSAARVRPARPVQRARHDGGGARSRSIRCACRERRVDKLRGRGSTAESDGRRRGDARLVRPPGSTSPCGKPGRGAPSSRTADEGCVHVLSAGGSCRGWPDRGVRERGRVSGRGERSL